MHEAFQNPAPESIKAYNLQWMGGLINMQLSGGEPMKIRNLWYDTEGMYNAIGRIQIQGWSTSSPKMILIWPCAVN